MRDITAGGVESVVIVAIGPVSSCKLLFAFIPPPRSQWTSVAGALRRPSATIACLPSTSIPRTSSPARTDVLYVLLRAYL